MTNENVRFFSPFFQLQKYNYFLNLQFFLQRFFFFYILSYQQDKQSRTKMLIYETNSDIYRRTTPKPYISKFNVHAYIKYINKIDLYMI